MEETLSDSAAPRTAPHLKDRFDQVELEITELVREDRDFAEKVRFGGGFGNDSCLRGARSHPIGRTGDVSFSAPA